MVAVLVKTTSGGDSNGDGCDICSISGCDANDGSNVGGDSDSGGNGIWG